MPDFVLKDGREIEFDLYSISKKEYDSLSDIEQKPEEEYELIGRVTGLSADEVSDIPLGDYQLMIFELIKRVRNFYSNPN